MTEAHSDFDFEPVRGLPQLLPEGERVLWQGAPRWQDLAVHAFHARKVIWYFAAIAVAQSAFRYVDGESLLSAVRSFEWLGIMAFLAAGLLTGLAYLSARTSVYTITNKRIVMRIGMALSVTINLPFKQIDGASLRLFRNASGDIALKLNSKERVAYMLLWPHARRFHMAHPQPSLRCIADADRVAGLLAAALNGQATEPLARPEPAPRMISSPTPAAA
jgi:hypothetical protein